jgi:hypothetical protein
MITDNVVGGSQCEVDLVPDKDIGLVFFQAVSTDRRALRKHHAPRAPEASRLTACHHVNSTKLSFLQSLIYYETRHLSLFALCRPIFLEPLSCCSAAVSQVRFGDIWFSSPASLGLDL